ncbi:hypothetical protein DLH77_23840 [Vibrio parahaemolyticus]|uniref:hypothetical protein n=1 Tax=Vibrio parahaemolyticus TaxID=670 RepID=UPI001DB22429|nr:hypothetical protein [Vibrio parahaemolyticus]EGR3135934.1 hypothetical protein [Vibrio parahaemolyticus]EGR3159719.1 hypothetical protein [Vibrio parahaemolyticus]EHY8868516.1 hypothetical protein [Vibrio parahaemolyticus]EII3132137.1 hypothetical protein [Vibrio parahaemolyticus]EJG1508092.1 hypothetical protein [Vibrio parahaemolyticus]
MKINVRDVAMLFVGFYLGAVILAIATDNKMNVSEVFNVLVPFLSTGGAMAAILAIIQVSQNSNIDRVYKRTVAEVDEIVEQINSIRTCLFDNGKPKNIRVEWIQAAKAILGINSLLISIEKSSYENNFPELVLKANRLVDDFSTELYKTLCIKSGNVSGPLPVSFFYGVTDFEAKSMSEAKVEAIRSQSVVYGADQVAPPYGTTMLDERSVYIVAKFINHERLVSSYDEVTVKPLRFLGLFEGFGKYLEEESI